VRYSGDLSNSSARSEVLASPVTPSLSSSNSLTASSARHLPTLSWPSRKKLFPASSGVTLVLSRMVKWPTPGRTKFFKIEVEVAEPEMTRMRAFSSAACPVAAQRLISNH
jgi:hypothetical protein